jgi:hypothetical protein
MLSKTWLTEELLSNSGIELPWILHQIVFTYNAFFAFGVFAFGLIFFVLSLEEGFYSYQFKQIGWSLVNMIVIVSAGHGHLSGMWRLRLWFVYTWLCLALRDLVDNIFSRYFPLKSPLHVLSPKATKLGYITGAVAAFIFYY